MDDPAHDSYMSGDIGSPGEIGVGIHNVLNSILEQLQNPIVRPRAQIALIYSGTGPTTDVYNTHVRYFIDRIVIPTQNMTFRADLVVGGNKIIEGIQPLGGTIECAIIIDSGVDVALVSSNGVNAPFSTRQSVLLVGEIIND